MKSLPTQPEPQRELKPMQSPRLPLRQPGRQIRQALERKDTAGTGKREVRSFALEIRATGDDGSIEGYGSVFGVKDHYDDVIAPGAFVQTLKDHAKSKTMPAMLWQHDATEPIGVWLEMVEDKRGLKIKGQLALETTRGKEAYALLKLGALNGLSIGFISIKWEYDTDKEIRTLTEVDLWEVSLVTFPANEKSRITGVKSAGEISSPKDAERTLRDAGFSKAEATAMVSRLMRMGEERRDSADSTAKALKSADRLIASLKTSTESNTP